MTINVKRIENRHTTAQLLGSLTTATIGLLLIIATAITNKCERDNTNTQQKIEHINKSRTSSINIQKTR